MKDLQANIEPPPGGGQDVLAGEGSEVLEAELVEDGGVGVVLAAVGDDGLDAPLVRLLVRVDEVERHVGRHLHAGQWPRPFRWPCTCRACSSRTRGAVYPRRTKTSDSVIDSQFQI